MVKEQARVAVLAVAAFFAALAVSAQDPSDKMQAQQSDKSSAQSSGASSSISRDAQGVVSAWPETTKKAARALIDKYGQPDEVSDTGLAWNDKDRWARVAVFRDARRNAVGLKHEDFVENTVRYRVPKNMIVNLASFDKTLYIDPDRGTLSARGSSEENNTLTLNLADEIVKGKRDVASAKSFFKTLMTESMTGKSSQYGDKLMFSPSPVEEFQPITPGRPY